jgi:transposase
MTNPSTKYTDEYRRETADYIISTGRPIVEVAAEIGVNKKTASHWVAKRRRQLSGDVDPKTDNAELVAAQKHIRELEMENAFLKKAAAFFAKEQA